VHKIEQCADASYRIADILGADDHRVSDGCEISMLHCTLHLGSEVKLPCEAGTSIQRHAGRERWQGRSGHGSAGAWLQGAQARKAPRVLSSGRLTCVSLHDPRLFHL
jgi:hypothetical protein